MPGGLTGYRGRTKLDYSVVNGQSRSCPKQHRPHSEMYVALLIIVQIGDATWGDQLLTYDGGSTMTYDEIGNPLSYRGFTFTWQRGRQLATVQGNGASLSFQL